MIIFFKATTQPVITHKDQEENGLSFKYDPRLLTCSVSGSTEAVTTYLNTHGYAERTIDEVKAFLTSYYNDEKAGKTAEWLAIAEPELTKRLAMVDEYILPMSCNFDVEV